MMTSNSAAEKIRAYIREKMLLGREDVEFDNDTHLTESGIIDSFGVIELVSLVEETFNVEFGPDELVTENLASVSKIVRFLNRKNAASN